MTSGYFPRWQTTHSQALSIFQDGDQVKFFTQPGERCGCQNPYPGRALQRQIPVGCPPPPPPSWGKPFMGALQPHA